MKSFVPLLFLLVTFLCVSRASAGCVEYLDSGTAFCSAEGGCEGSYPVITCVFGMIPGRCFNGPNGGLCCGSSFDVAQIYPESGTCDGGFFGGILGRRHHRSKKTLASLNKTSEISLLSCKLPRMLFLPSRCEHVYEVLFEDYAPIIAKRN